MASERFEMRFPTDLMERVDRARGHEPRASFVKRMVEAALGGEALVVSAEPPKRQTRITADGGHSAPPAPPPASGPSEERVREAKAKVAGACKTHGRPANRVGGRCNLAGCMG